MKTFFFSLLTCLLANAVYSQSLDAARKYFYYENWSSAKTEFEKNSNTNPEAAYWLVQSMLANYDGPAQVKIAIANAEKNFPGNTLIMVSKAHQLLFEGNKEEAKKIFEAAINSSGNNKAQVLNAVGRAHGNVQIKYSDPDYAIAKLKECLKLEPKNGAIYINLGDCYRRKLDGGAAVEAYKNAMTTDPSLSAQANYKVGKVFATQQNCEVLARHFNDALKADPLFMPAARELFENYADRESMCFNMDLAKRSFDKLSALLPNGIDKELFEMNFLYSIADYNAAVKEASSIISSMPSQVPSRVYKLMGYCYFQMKDYTNTVNRMEKYFSEEKDPGNIVPDNYKITAIAWEQGKRPDKAKEYYIKAADAEPVIVKKIPYLNSAAEICTKERDFKGAAILYQQIANNKSNPSATDLFKLGTSYFNAGDYQSCIQTFNTYSEKFPKDWRGPLWIANSEGIIDSTGITWKAIPYFEKFIALALVSNPLPKESMVRAYFYLFAYENNSKKNKVAAIAYLDKILALDPENKAAIQYKSQLSGN